MARLTREDLDNLKIDRERAKTLTKDDLSGDYTDTRNGLSTEKPTKVSRTGLSQSWSSISRSGLSQSWGDVTRI